MFDYFCIYNFCQIARPTRFHSWPQDSALQIPSPSMNLKAGALQALRLTTLMTSLEAVVLNQIRNSDKIRQDPIPWEPLNHSEPLNYDDLIAFNHLIRTPQHFFSRVTGFWAGTRVSESGWGQKTVQNHSETFNFHSIWAWFGLSGSQSDERIVLCIILWPCIFGLLGLWRSFRSMCQVQLAHAVLERGVCLTQLANAQLYDLCTAIGILGSTEIATGAFQFSRTNISAMQCMDSFENPTAF